MRNAFPLPRMSPPPLAMHSHLPHMPPAMHVLLPLPRTSPHPDRQGACENITLSQTSFAGGSKESYS